MGLNSDRYLELFIGIPCADRVIVPHNTRWAEPELRYATVDAGAPCSSATAIPAGWRTTSSQVIRLDTGEYEELLAARASSSRRSLPTAWPGCSTPVARRERPRA